MLGSLKAPILRGVNFAVAITTAFLILEVAAVVVGKISEYFEKEVSENVSDE